jgi:hypothetical protein
LKEWIALLTEAKKLGITLEEVKNFFGGKENDEKRNSGGICENEYFRIIGRSRNADD